MDHARAQRWYLKEWRLKRGLTQEELAERTGTNMIKADISRLELGKRRWNADQLWKLADALEIEAWWLLAIDPDDPANDLTMLETLRAVPEAKRRDALAILAALASR